MTAARLISYTDITTAWSGPVYSLAQVTRKAAAAGGSLSFMQADFDSNSNLIRTYDLSSGRMDLWGPSVSGAAMVVAYSGAAVNGNNLGHYAYRGQDSNGNYNTYAYMLANAAVVSAAGISGKLSLSVCQNVAAGAGNAQPNWGIVIDGSTSQVTLPTGAAISASGNFTSAAATGPTFTFNNTANSRTMVVGMADNFSGSIDATGGGNLNLKVGGATAISISSLNITTSLPVKIAQDQRTTKTSSYPVVSGDGGTVFDNSTAAGEVDFTLPSAPIVGWKAEFNVVTAQILGVVAPASTTINVGGTVSAAAGNIKCSQVGAWVELEYIGSNKYVAKRVTGTGGSSGAGGWTVT